MKIESLQLHNFRCFEDVEIKFHDKLTVLVGINGSGKTSILDAIHAFFDEVMTCLARENFHAWKLHDDDMKAGKDNMEIEFSIISSAKINPAKKKFNLKFKRDNWSLSIQSEPLRTVLQMCDFLKSDTENLVYCYFNSERNTTLKENFNSSNPFIWFKDKENEEAREALRRGDTNFRIPELERTRQAIRLALGNNYNAPYVDKTPPELFITMKNDPTPYKVTQLSAGYFSMFHVILHIANQMAVKNPNNKSPFDSPAIVLIDEVELHLHPSWQQRVLPDLMRIFPNTQFIVTTHSPQVLTSIASENIRILDNGKVYDAPAGAQGAEASRLLKRILGVDSRPPKDPITQKLEQYKNLVYADLWHTKEAKELRQDLNKSFQGEEPCLLELDLHIENRKWELGQ